MSVSRSFRVLNLYDVFTNLVPGAVLLLILVTAFNVDTTGHSAGLVLAAFTVLSLVLGHAVQALASYWDGTPTLFKRTIQAAKDDENVSTAITITDVERRFWPLCKRTFDLNDDFAHYRRLIQLVLAYLETTPQTRALRFQVIHSFCRSLWTVSKLAVIVAIISIGVEFLGFMNMASYPVLLAIGGSGGVGWYTFSTRKKEFNKRFVEYLICDFYSDRVTRTDQKDQRTE